MEGKRRWQPAAAAALAAAVAVVMAQAQEQLARALPSQGLLQLSMGQRQQKVVVGVGEGWWPAIEAIAEEEVGEEGVLAPRVQTTVVGEEEGRRVGVEAQEEGWGALPVQEQALAAVGEAAVVLQQAPGWTEKVRWPWRVAVL